MNTNYGLTYPKETDFYDINIFNRNFSTLADGIDKAKNNNTVKSNYEICSSQYYSYVGGFSL